MSVRSNFKDFYQQHQDNVDLREAMFQVSLEEDPHASIEEMQANFQQIIAGLYLPKQDDIFDCVARINLHLFKKHGFTGNVDDYYSPANSLIHKVLQHKTGLPIMLSAVYIEVGKEIDFPIKGIGFPGHFIIQPNIKDKPFYIDPFRNGEILCSEDLEKILTDRYKDKYTLEESTKPQTNQQILLRMSGNLFHAYQRKKNPIGMLRNVERMLVLEPSAFNLYRTRAQVFSVLGQYKEAAKSLELYIEKNPTGKDIEECIQELSLLKGIG